LQNIFFNTNLTHATANESHHSLTIKYDIGALIMVYSQPDNRLKIIFLGTPQVAAKSLLALQQHSHLFKIILAVSQPPARSHRNGKETPSPVHLAALEHGIPVLTPQSAKEPEFITTLQELKPDLCITAAYGNYLPKSFLAIPNYGTLNIHPSLLPLYRGAAPVQRCIESGDTQTGVSILLSVAAMDAGPILVQEKLIIDENIKSPELLDVLFEKGTELLIKSIPNYVSGKMIPYEQNHNNATHAEKIKPEEAKLDLNINATILHNKVRAFAGWPGTKLSISLNEDVIEMKVIKTKVSKNTLNLKIGELFFTPQSLCLGCGNNSVLEVLEMQLPGKKPVTAKDFQNGIRNQELKINF